MPNEYSVQIHDYLTERIAEAAKKAAHEENPFFPRGQLEELHWLRRYLKENIDLKDFVYY